MTDKKCLILTCEYPPTEGGIANAAASFAKALTQRGWKITVCSAEIAGEPPLHKTSTGDVHRLPIRGDTSIWNPLSGNIAEFELILRQLTPDVVVIHGWQSWYILMLSRIRKAGIPVILQSHGFGYHLVNWNGRPPFGLKTWAGYLPFIARLPSLIRKLHAFVVLSHKPNAILSFDHWLGAKTHCHNVITIPNGVERPRGTQEEFLSKYPNLTGKTIVLCVANYCDRKNQLAALQVVQRMEDPDVHLVLIGGEENDYSRQVRQRVESLDLAGRVTVLTAVPRIVTEGAIAACKVALMTSKFEMQPLFLLEAMALGKPWVSTPVGSVAELAGGLVVGNGIDALAASVSTLLADATLYATLSQNGFKQWKDEYIPNVVYDQWERLLLSATSHGY